MSDNALSAEAKRFVVQSLACFDSPSVVAKAVKDQFGVVITRQAVEWYDPTKAAGSKDPEVKAAFDEARAAFLEASADIGISHRVTRLRRLERLIDRAETQGNVALAAQLLMQAAKEVGDVYTNRQRIDANHTVASHEDALAALDGA